MWALLLATIMTSAADSLNPFAITQQFVLQGMVKKRQHIWYFIIPTGVTNLIGGFLAYYGLVSFIGDGFRRLVDRFGAYIYIAVLILGVIFVVSVGFIRQNKKIRELQAQLKPEDSDEERETAAQVRSVSPRALIALGVGATISELTTALPYFAFLAILFNYQLNLWQVSLILLVYNVIYMGPLMLMYLIYVKAQERFDALYRWIHTRIERWSELLAPLLAGLIGVVLVYYSLLQLMRL